jgi:hypothetical protein
MNVRRPPPFRRGAVHAALLACALACLPALAQTGSPGSSVPEPAAGHPVLGAGNAGAPADAMRDDAPPDDASDAGDAAMSVPPPTMAPSAASDAAAAGFAARQAEISRRNAENAYRYGVARHDCYSRFFVNRCLDQAHAAMRDERTSLRAAQNALDADQRAERIQRREANAALTEARTAADATRRAEQDQRNEQSYANKQRAHELDQAKRAAQEPQRQASQQAWERKQAERRQKLEQARAQAAADEQRRDENERKFAEKQDAAARHKVQVDARRANAKSGQSPVGAALQPGAPR